LVLLVNDSEYSKSTGAKSILYRGCIYLVWRALLLLWRLRILAAAAARHHPTPPPLFFWGGGGITAELLFRKSIFLYRQSEAGNVKYCYEFHARSGLRFIIRLQKDA
jgi:hypothetical protein